MSGIIPREKIDEIRKAADIVEVIGDYMQLKKQGRNYFGLCPFHGENTPSFSVSQDKQIYRCFGCGAGGNVVSFMMDIDGVSFQEAIIKLADRTNVSLDLTVEDVESKELSPAAKLNQELINVHELLVKFYHHLLVNTKEGQTALEYLLNRGFSMESIEKYNIGYSLPSWDFVTKWLQKKGYSTSVLETAGLIIKRDRDDSYFDRFRNRIMFPIADNKGNVVAFSGRSLTTEEQPKYMNSPETPIFNKSSVLFNYFNARPHIKKQHQAILFEGFADVISASEAEVLNGIATMGTSLTDNHVQSIRRLSDQVTICYDSDSAGTHAAYKAANMLQKNGCTIRIAKMPNQLDPDDYIQQFGAEKFRQNVIGASVTFMAFKMDYYRQGKNLQNEGEKLDYLEKIINEISLLDKAIEREHYLKQLSEEFSLSLDALKDQQKQAYWQNKKNNKISHNKKVVVNNYQEKRVFPAHLQAERILLCHMLKSDEIAYKVKDLLEDITFYYDDHLALFTYLLGYYEKGYEPDSSTFITFLPDEKLRRIVTELEMMTVSDEISDDEIEDYLQQLRKNLKLVQIQEKEKLQKEAEQNNDFSKALAIGMEVLQLRKSL